MHVYINKSNNNNLQYINKKVDTFDYENFSVEQLLPFIKNKYIFVPPYSLETMERKDRHWLPDKFFVYDLPNPIHLAHCKPLACL